MKICSAVLRLLHAYTWTDEAILPALPRDANASKMNSISTQVQVIRPPVENPTTNELSMQYASQNGRFYH